MYTEIKEAVNFLSKYLLGKIPRRTVSLFAQELANYLIIRYMEIWNIDDPTKDELNRVIRIRYNGVTDQLVISAALAVGMERDELLGCAPDSVLLFVNPGSVYYKCNERATPCAIWLGDVNADDDYRSIPANALQPLDQPGNAGPVSNMGAAGKTIYAGRILSGETVNAVEDPYVPLQLDSVHPAAIDSPLSSEAHSTMKQFTFVPKDHKTYTVEDFAVTRFGSHRSRPDHDVMRRIQLQAGLKTAAERPTVHSATMAGSGDSAANSIRNVPMPPSALNVPLANNNLMSMNNMERDVLINYLKELNLQGAGSGDRASPQLPPPILSSERQFARPPSVNSDVFNMFPSSRQEIPSFSHFGDPRLLMDKTGKRNGWNGGADVGWR